MAALGMCDFSPVLMFVASVHTNMLVAANHGSPKPSTSRIALLTKGRHSTIKAPRIAKSPSVSKGLLMSKGPTTVQQPRLLPEKEEMSYYELMWYFALYASWALNRAWAYQAQDEEKSKCRLSIDEPVPKVEEVAEEVVVEEEEKEEKQEETQLVREYNWMVLDNTRAKSLPALAVNAANANTRKSASLRIGMLKQQMARKVITHGIDVISEQVKADSADNAKASLALADFHSVKTQFQVPATGPAIQIGSPKWKRLCRVMSFLRRNAARAAAEE
jgi:hypothetical protein